MNSANHIERDDNYSKRPCKSCKSIFILKDKLSKYCSNCKQMVQKNLNIEKHLNLQLSMRVCVKCRNRFVIGKYYSKFCNSCCIQDPKPQLKKNSTTNVMSEYLKKANVGVRWGREFICIDKKEVTPILLMEGKYYIIKPDGNLKCVGNRLPSRSFVVQKYEDLLTTIQLTTLQKLISF